MNNLSIKKNWDGVKIIFLDTIPIWYIENGWFIGLCNHIGVKMKDEKFLIWTENQPFQQLGKYGEIL